MPKRSRLLHEPARLAGASLLRLQSDERLAALARDGHEPAFAAIVHRYQAPLLRYCAGIVGAARAEDAVQQAFINAHDALPRLTEVRHLKSWLHRIAHNVSLNTLRATRDEVELDAGAAALSGQPADAYESAERLRATLQAVRDLPERQRAALLLRELEGRSHDEIARALGTTAGGARQHLMRARAAVRQAATAITPYPLIAKLAGAVADPSAARVAEAVAGAGAGATVVKLTAGLAATGALVGGVVGTSAVTHRHPAAPAAAKVERVNRDGSGLRARDVALVTSGTTLRRGTGGSFGTGTRNSDEDRGSSGGDRRTSGEHHRGTSDRDSSGSGSGDDRRSSGEDHRGTSDRDSSGSGSSGSGSGDDRRSGSGPGSRDGGGRDDRSGSGTSGSGTSGSGTSGSGTSGSGTSGSGTSGGDDHLEGGTSGTSGSGSGSDDGLSGSGSGSGSGDAFDDTPSTTTPTTTTPESHSGSGKSLPDDAVELPH